MIGLVTRRVTLPPDSSGMLPALPMRCDEGDVIRGAGDVRRLGNDGDGDGPVFDCCACGLNGLSFCCTACCCCCCTCASS